MPALAEVLRGTSCKLQAASCKLQAASFKLQATSCKRQAIVATSYKLQTSISKSHSSRSISAAYWSGSALASATLLPTVALAFVLPRVAPPSPATRAVVLALDNLGDGDESEEVELYDGDSQSSLPCFLAGTISVGGATYGALHPVNLPVSIATYEDDELMPEKLAEEYECASYPDADSVLRGARNMLSRQLADEPQVRRHVRQQYRNEIKVETAPTARGGKEEIDRNHRLNGIRHIAKPAENLRGQEFLLIQEAERGRLITVSLVSRHDMAARSGLHPSQDGGGIVVDRSRATRRGGCS